MSEDKATYAPTNTVKVKRLSADAKIPQYETPGAAAFDLAATNSATIPAGGCTAFGTGLAFEVPQGQVMMVYSRSGHGFKNSVRLSNCSAVIDSDYRGEVRIKLHNDSDTDFEVNAGDRIAQAMIVAAPQYQLVEADELSTTARGEGGFGSTGTQVNEAAPAQTLLDTPDALLAKLLPTSTGETLLLEERAYRLATAVIPAVKDFQQENLIDNPESIPSKLELYFLCSGLSHLLHSYYSPHISHKTKKALGFYLDTLPGFDDSRDAENQPKELARHHSDTRLYLAAAIRKLTNQ